jgi:DNA-binding transcriptional LysR family regulator
LPLLRERYPRVEVELVVEDRLVDIVAGGFDAGIRLHDIIERDMVRVRLTAPFRFLVVGAPSYFARHGIPKHPKDLAKHECIAFRSPTDGAPYAWEFEHGRKSLRVAAEGGVTTNDGLASASLARLGLGLAYVPEPIVSQDIHAGTLIAVLESYAPTERGFFLYHPQRSQRSALLRPFIALAKEVLRG